MSDRGAVKRMLLTNIGELVTNDPAPDRDGGPLGIVRDAAVLVEDGRVAWIGSAASAAARSSSSAAEGDAYRDAEVVDAGGRAVIPGFVDSHTHLVFGGDRAE